MKGASDDISGLIEKYQWPEAIAVTGALGSGKTETVLNLALGFQKTGEQVSIADVDIINPYFCVRQVADSLSEKGFKVISPPESTRWSDMPLINPEVGWAIASGERRLLLDVGGDAAGVRALKQFIPHLRSSGYLLILVVNPFRPKTSTVEGIKRMVADMESISGLEVGAIIGNPHLMSETRPEDVLLGLRLAQEAESALGLRLLFGMVSPMLAGQLPEMQNNSNVPLWPMERHMMLPWEEGYMWTRSSRD